MRKAALREEIIRCGKDPSYFINRYVRIRHPIRGIIPFHMFPYQERALEGFISRRLNIALKPRQMGLTELVSAYIVWLILFHRDMSVLCLSTKSETAKNLIRRVRTALKNIPRWLLISDIVTDNKTSIELANGSWVKSVSKAGDAGRSEALSLLVIDEAAHIEGFEPIWTGIKPTVSAGGRIIMISTPNGVGNVYHKVYTEALSGENDFNAIHIDWWEHPEHISDLTVDPKTGRRTSSWFRTETKGLSTREIAQEYECEFLASGDTFFTADIISYVMSMGRESLPTGGDPELERVYQPPVQGRKYIMGADSATGDGRDYSAFHVFDVETLEQVYEYKARRHPDEYAEKLCEVGERYNWALLAIENNAVGLAVIEHLKLRGYRNMFYTRRGARPGDKMGEIGHAADGSMPSDYVRGINTSGANRSLMLAKLEELLREQKMRVYSTRFRAEMETFVWNNGRPEARGGRTDDLIMAAAFAAMVREQVYGDSYNTADIAQAMLASMRVERTVNTQLPGASKNPDHVPGRMIGTFSTPTRPYVMQMPNGKYVDLMAEMGMYVPRKG